MAPILLPANQPPARPYRGGRQISSFRSTTFFDPRQPEDWIASTTCCHGCTGTKLGMTYLPNGHLFADLIAEQPEYWLGAEHVRAFGTDTKLLVKLIDAGERLFVHAHPHADWARKHIGAAHGKAEAWLILTPGKVHLGLKEDISQNRLLELVEQQRGDELLKIMHQLEVEAFETLYVPPGTLHAIGEGILLVEVQEPEDLSILCEWKGFEIDGAKDGHLGLGFETALTAINTTGCSKVEIQKLVTANVSHGSVIVKEGKEYFEMERIQVDDAEKKCQRGFAILIVCEGSVKYSAYGSDGAISMDLSKGTTLVIPHGDGEFSVYGKGQIVVVRPPRPQ